MISGLASIKVVDNFLSDKETSDLLAQLEAGESPRNEVWRLQARLRRVQYFWGRSRKGQSGFKACFMR